MGKNVFGVKKEIRVMGDVYYLHDYLKGVNNENLHRV